MKQAGGSDSIYVMPWNIQVLYVYYRPSIFEAAGVEVPKTYEEFLTAIEKCTMDTDGDGKTDVYGFGMRGRQGRTGAVGQLCIRPAAAASRI